jgi:hypothetical protein
LCVVGCVGYLCLDVLIKMSNCSSLILPEGY